MRQKFFVVVMMLFVGLGTTIAQQGFLKGKITDSKTGEELVGAAIVVDGTTTGTITDFMGEYTMPPLDAGTYTIRVQYISYDPQVFNNVVINAGEETLLNIQLASATMDIEEVAVVAKANRESENMLMIEQKKAAVAVEAIGAKELSRKGVTNVASGLKKVTGVSMMGSKNLFVRGLGDRYNAVMLNGLPLTSPDPVKKIVKLDMFATDIVKVLEVKKVYSSRDYADYTGALINIETKDYPSEPFLKIGFGGKYNTQSTFKDFYKIKAEGNNFMAFDVKDRLNLTPQEYRGREVNRFMEIGNDFNTTAFDKEKITAMPNINLSIAGGKLFEFDGGKKLGIMFSSSFKNGFEHLPDVIQSPVVERQGGGTQINFTSQKYNYSVLFSNMADITFALNDKHEFRYDVLYLNNGLDGFNKKVGLNEDWGEDKDYVIFLSNYQNYRLFNNQLQGSHALSEKLKVDWNCNLINAKYAVPDRREIGFEPYGDQYTFMNETGFRAGRIIVEQNTDEQNAKLSLGYDVNEKFNVVAGGQYNHKELEYLSHAYDYVMEANLEDVGLFDIDDDSYSDALQGLTQGAGYVSRIRNWTRDDMGYTGNSSIAAGFVDFTFKTTKLTINVGLRIEKSEMNLTSNMTELDGDEEEYTFDDTDLFPAFNAKYSLTDNANLRMAVSRTVVRPSFYEKTPAYLYPEPGELTIMGNPYTKEEPNADMGYLENSYSTNFDIKYEWFPTQGDMLALSIYGKNISEPIERVQLEKEVYMRNLDKDALAAGVELEVKKKINDFNVGMNAAYIYTHVDIPEENGENDSERGLQGAAPYLINADAGYSFKFGLDEKVNTYVGFVYNVFGKRLYKVGVEGIGNAYQLPINKLDLLVKNKINNKLDINLTINNLLDSKFTIEQDIYDSNDRVAKNKVTDEYKTGVTVGIGVSYKF